MAGSDQKQLDAWAKKKGFPNYAAMKAWNEKYRKPATRTVTPKKSNNFFKQLLDFHPLNYSANRITSAMKKAEKR
jgi:hypothetical protein